jgi:hypothetical protein
MGRGGNGEEMVERRGWERVEEDGRGCGVVPMDEPMIHSHEASPSYNISMFCNIAVSILSVGFVPNVFSIMCRVSTVRRTAVLQRRARLGDSGRTVSI